MFPAETRKWIFCVELILLKTDCIPLSLSLPLLQLLSTKIQVTVAEPLVIEFPDVASWFIVIAFLPEFWLLPNLY